MDAIGWVGVRTERFEPIVSFVEEGLGLPAIDRGPDSSIHGLPGGEILEVLGPSEREHEHFVTGPVPGFRVRSSAAAIEEAGGELVLGATELEDGAGWQHFRAPDGFLYEVVVGPFAPRPAGAVGVGVRGLKWVGTRHGRLRCHDPVPGTGSGPGTGGGGARRADLPARRRLGDRSVRPRPPVPRLLPGRESGPVVAFLVDRLGGAWDRLVEAGAERSAASGTAEWGWAHVRLPDGNLYEVLAPRSP